MNRLLRTRKDSAGNGEARNEQFMMDIGSELLPWIIVIGLVVALLEKSSRR